jgi:hypothetical protein
VLPDFEYAAMTPPTKSSGGLTDGKCLYLHAYDVMAATVFNFANYAKEAVSELA